jgi:hypothetical protein
MEWIWRPYSDSLGNSTQIFTHMLDYGYAAPDGFGFDLLDDEDPFIIDKNFETYNAELKAGRLIKQLTERINHYKTNQMLVLFGEDFRYMSAFQNYKNMDTIIAYMNEHHGDQFHFIYSTPSTYVKAVNALDVEWPTKTDDMFPYADNPNGYWTGYFSSRANDKEQIRRFSSYYHASN